MTRRLAVYPGGDNRDGHCTLMLGQCDAFAFLGQCQTECAEVPDAGGFDVSETEGDSPSCRLYRLGVAMVGPLNHCLRGG